MKRKVFLAAALFLALGTIGLLSQQDGNDHGQEGAVLTGGWYWHIDLQDYYGPGAGLPSLLIFHDDGTGACSDSVAFGGIPGNVYRYTPLYGVWERKGSHKFRATFLSLRFDTTNNNLLVGILRSRATFAFTKDSDHMTGTMHLDFLPCTGGNPLACPNPLLAQESDWQPWGGIPDLKFTGARTSVVPY